MTNTMKFRVLIALTMICVLALSATATAAGNRRAGPDTSKFQAKIGDAPDAPLILNTVVKKTSITSGAPSLAVPANTFTTLDPGGTIICPGTTGNCRLLVDAWATSAGSGNRALCVVVDGSIAGFCAFLGNDQSSGFSRMTNLEGPITVGHGTHTVSIVAFSTGGTTVAFFRTLWRMYKP